MTHETRRPVGDTTPLAKVNLRVPQGFRALLRRARALETIRSDRTDPGGVLLYKLLEEYVRVAEKGGGR